MAEETLPKLVLASASPRRMQLLEQVGLTPNLLNPTDIDETPRRRETPRRLSIRLADEKAKAAIAAPLVKALGKDVYIVAADTVVGMGRRILPKPANAEEAMDCLKLLTGRAHWVYSTVTIVAPGGKTSTRCCETKIRFKRLSRPDMETYIASGEWRGKAGGYAIQGRAAAFVRYLAGSHSGVVGLPLYETLHLLEGAGFPLHKIWQNLPPVVS